MVNGMISFINMIQLRITCEESFSEGLSTSGWPVGMFTYRTVLIELTDVGRHSPQWVAPFPRQEIQDCTEWRNQAECKKAGTMHSFSLCS